MIWVNFGVFYVGFGRYDLDFIGFDIVGIFYGIFVVDSFGEWNGYDFYIIVWVM